MKIILKLFVFAFIYSLQIIFLLYLTVLSYGELKPNPTIAIGSLVAILTTLKLGNYFMNNYIKVILYFNNITYKKINSKKKTIAFEFLLLIASITFAATILSSADYFRTTQQIKNKNLQLDVNELENNHFRNRFNFLSDKYYTTFGSYERFKNEIKQDKDTTYRKWIYQLLQESNYFTETTSFDEYLVVFENIENIELIDSSINKMKKEIYFSDTLYENCELFIIIMFILIYPVRLLYKLIKWAILVLNGD